MLDPADSQLPVRCLRRAGKAGGAFCATRLKSPEPPADTSEVVSRPGLRAVVGRHTADAEDAEGGQPLPSNNVQRYREALMMSKAELARKAGLSTLTIDRVEAGRPCRLDTKRKVLLALGLRISDKDRVFGLKSDAAIASPLLAGAETRS
jgi:DNA-binding XRE family transcriptional regulator